MKQCSRRHLMSEHTRATAEEQHAVVHVHVAFHAAIRPIERHCRHFRRALFCNSPKACRDASVHPRVKFDNVLARLVLAKGRDRERV